MLKGAAGSSWLVSSSWRRMDPRGGFHSTCIYIHSPGLRTPLGSLQSSPSLWRSLECPPNTSLHECVCRVVAGPKRVKYLKKISAISTAPQQQIRRSLSRALPCSLRVAAPPPPPPLPLCRSSGSSSTTTFALLRLLLLLRLRLWLPLLLVVSCRYRICTSYTPPLHPLGGIGVHI